VTHRDVILDGAIALAAVNGAAGLLGLLRWYRYEMSRTFWYAVRVGQAAAILYAVLTGVYYLANWRPSDKLFYLYALLPVAIGFVAEQLRVISADQVLASREIENAAAVGELPPGEQQQVVVAILRREMGVMAAAAIVVCFLALRAWGTY
jgi:hypothetical protein